MINKLIEQIGGRERLEEMSQCSDVTKLFAYEMRNMARALLAVLDAQSKPALVLRPFGYDGETFRKSDIDHHAAVVYYTAPPAASAPYALREAVNAIYFNDSSDYLSALWSVVRALSPETADLFARDERAAFERVNANIEHAAAPAPGGDGG